LDADLDPKRQLILLEGFELQFRGEPVLLPSSSQRLVAFLALQDRLLPRAYVAGTLWSQAPEDRARASLRSALWRLRRTSTRVLEGSGGKLGLSPNIAVDTQRLTFVAHQAIEGSFMLDDHSIEVLIRAGELLPGWYEDWVTMDRERLRQLRLHALESLCAQLVARRDFPRAVEAGLAAVATEPLRESAHMALSTAYLAEGNRGEAVRDFQVFCELLRSELDVEPSSALARLVGVSAASSG
jgi:DNA-binding SARP family transcriptional activator